MELCTTPSCTAEAITNRGGHRVCIDCAHEADRAKQHECHDCPVYNACSGTPMECKAHADKQRGR